MPIRNKTADSQKFENEEAPKSFSPQANDSLRPNAWMQLDRLAQSSNSPAPTDGPEQLIALARTTIRARRIRKNSLPNEMFGEPAWDMLLTLYVGSRSGARQTVSHLSISSGSSQTTALRWIDYLETQAFVARRASPTDRRVTFIDMTEAGRLAVEGYFVSLLTEVGADAVIGLKK